MIMFYINNLVCIVLPFCLQVSSGHIGSLQAWEAPALGQESRSIYYFFVCEHIHESVLLGWISPCVGLVTSLLTINVTMGSKVFGKRWLSPRLSASSFDSLGAHPIYQQHTQPFLNFQLFDPPVHITATWPKNPFSPWDNRSGVLTALPDRWFGVSWSLPKSVWKFDLQWTTVEKCGKLVLIATRTGLRYVHKPDSTRPSPWLWANTVIFLSNLLSGYFSNHGESWGFGGIFWGQMWYWI